MVTQHLEALHEEAEGMLLLRLGATRPPLPPFFSYIYFFPRCYSMT
jgi:hypothetical protein